MMAETVDIQVQLQEKWLILWWSLGIGLLALGVSGRQGLFKPFHSSPLPQIGGIDVLKGFVFFLFIELFLLPTFIGLVLMIGGMDPKRFLELSPQAKGWLNLLVILGGFGGVSLAYLGLTGVQRQQLWRQTSVSWYHNVGIGIAAWFVSYPLVLAFSQATSLAAWHLFHHSFIEQAAVQHLRSTLTDPLLFGAMAFAVVTIVPLTEEVLFRGLLQSWLKSKFHPAAAIGVSSLIFAIFHYSSDQGVANIELLSSLFLLSCMLGYIYERQRSLWAPVGLHSFFNFISLLMISKDP